MLPEKASSVIHRSSATVTVTECLPLLLSFSFFLFVLSHSLYQIHLLLSSCLIKCFSHIHIHTYIFILYMPNLFFLTTHFLIDFLAKSADASQTHIPNFSLSLTRWSISVLSYFIRFPLDHAFGFVFHCFVSPFLLHTSELSKIYHVVLSSYGYISTFLSVVNFILFL